MRSIKEIRRDNLKTLIKELGSVKKLAEIIDRDPSQISQIIMKKAVRGLGESFARKIEIETKKEPFWLDKDHNNLSDENKLNDFTDLSFNIEHLSASLESSAHNSEEKSMLNFTEEFFKGMGVKPQDVSWFEIQDESMEPTLKKGSRVIVNKTITTITSGDVYAVMIKDRLVVRRIFEEITGYRIACDNPNLKMKIPDEKITNFDENVKVLGKVIVICFSPVV